MDSGDPKAFVQFAEIAAKNAAIVSKYPFLLPIKYDGTCQKDYRFSYTEADAVPKGWHQLILDMSEEIMQYFKANDIDPLHFRIDQLKEKYGTLRCYYSFPLDGKFDDEVIDKIINKYEGISYHTCCECGREATLYSTGWICPYCQECAKKLILEGINMNFTTEEEEEKEQQENAQQI